MKKVLICYHSSQYGGVEKHILDIIEGLSGEFIIYIACPEGPLVEEYLKAGAKKHIEIEPKFEADFGYSLRIKTIIEKENIDIVHSHELLTGSLATFGAWLAGCKKRIYHVHTSFTEWRYSSFKRYPALIINTIVNFIVGNIFATDVLALTDSVKKVRINKEFISANKIKVIPNGVYS
jgi:glycosyltransferase involved in cell wall biosynthesis